MVIDQIANWAVERGIDRQTPSRRGYLLNILEELFEGIGSPCPRDDARHYVDRLLNEGTQVVGEQAYIDHLADISVFTLTEMLKYGYQPTGVLQEVYREIASRTGGWSDEENKWVKDTSPEAKARWYTAVYRKTE